MEYKNVEDCVSEVERRSNTIDTVFTATVLLYNQAAKFIMLFNVIIALFFTIFCIFTDYLNRECIIFCAAMYFISIVWQIIISSHSRRVMYDTLIQVKSDMGYTCFKNLESYETMEDWEREKIFNTSIIQAAGLIYKE